ncbi:hybrid sensor histidine kinase/response regulator [Sporomusa acidovorans]|uniref:histidine kinase n=1 Tax=Sporomusa acidovorans (strain ATCC 49682 / DSM 3132 / Mol) TaxID=1123286 RepID=A0ABZ3J8X3_SPOA4|nr:response regulator [Sporomusa acidovorans]OZC16242.1 phytochrome-like protein cph1 [Sporomusa acidovorans DSM 3132]SDE32446.1 Histidine kinase-, DNA gyrase B-, and HSP90-like ATPase [Sporomusa acidovorans]
MAEIVPSLNFPEILLVDDTPEDIEFALSVLRDNNFKVRVATKGSTALKLLEQHQPDLILLDIFMPEMDGFEVCKIIKEDTDYRNIPIIFLTSSNDEASIKKGFALGGQDYVIKPYNTSELLARVRTHIKLKQQTESLLAANRELDSFCYSVSHDLKAPLLSIGKLTEYLTADYQDKLGDDGNELLANIQEKSLEVIATIDHLLELSRTSEMQMHKETIHLERLFREVYDELVTLEPPRQITFTVNSLPDIQADPIMFKLLITNILSNSLKYTCNRKNATIEVSSFNHGGETVIAVKDNGAGFDMRYAARLFKVFQRLHSDNEFKGSGVGLAISQKIVKRHNGKAWITGETDKGATFYFSLPNCGG